MASEKTKRSISLTSRQKVNLERLAHERNRNRLGRKITVADLICEAIDKLLEQQQKPHEKVRRRSPRRGGELRRRGCFNSPVFICRS